MGKAVPGWQTFISCSGGSLIIRHLKSGLAEDLEIPWPAKLVTQTEDGWKIDKNERLTDGKWKFWRLD